MKPSLLGPAHESRNVCAKKNHALMSYSFGAKKWQKLTNMRKLQPEYKAMYAENNSITSAPSTDADWHFPLNLHLEGPPQKRSTKTNTSSRLFPREFPRVQRVCVGEG